MDELHFSIIKLFLSIISVIGLFWWAVRYMVKYKFYRQGVELRAEAKQEIDRLEHRIVDAEGDIYDLGIRMQATEKQVRDHIGDDG